MTTETVPAVLLARDKMKILQAVHYQHLGVMEAINRTEQAVLQSPEIQALRKDAERYRHLRDEAELCPHDIFNAWWLSDHGNPQTLDAAIDAAMEQKP